MTAEPRLIGLATASPPYTLDQDMAAEVAARMFEGRVFRTVDLKAIFANTGIKTRRTARPLEWYIDHKGWPERNEAYLEAAQDLFLEAAQKALAAAGVQASELGGVVTISSTGIATPSLEARLHGRLGLAPGVRRTPVFGLGCAGGVSGLALAGRLARAEPGKPILVVVVELCSLAYRPDDFSKASVVSAALFGDGAAAAVVVADDSARGRVLTAQAERLWPDSLNIMGWRIDPAGFGVVLASTLPAFITERLPAVIDSVFAETGMDRAAVQRFVCHPGGTRVLAALEGALQVEPGTLDHERGVLADFGNMSAPTVFFVLERVLAAGAHPGPLMMSALGPGFTATFLAWAPPMVEAVALLAFVTAQRLAELAWSRRNEARLRARGAVEAGAAHYPVMVALHATWIACLWAFGWDRPVLWRWAAVFFLLQLGRAWVLASLGERWTTRVIVPPGEPLVRRGPYRFISHPNYLVVALEVPVLPLALGLPWLALGFGLANLAMLGWRIRVEGMALAKGGAGPPPSASRPLPPLSGGGE